MPQGKKFSAGEACFSKNMEANGPACPKTPYREGLSLSHGPYMSDAMVNRFSRTGAVGEMFFIKV